MHICDVHMNARKRNDRTTPNAEAFLPLTPLAFEVLLSVAGGSRHGYAILRDIEERSEGAMVPHAGTLYRSIFRLVEQGLLEELDDAGEPEDDSRRRYYAMTPLGRRVATAEASRLASRVRTARTRKLLRGTGAG
jgi:DNA-binding PadR family transcriptional regulator